MSSRTILQGSLRNHPLHSVPAGKPAPGEPIQITIVLCRRNETPDPARLQAHLSHEQLSNLHGADPAHIDAIEEFASKHRLSIAKIDPAARTVTITGAFSAVADAFGADVELRKVDGEVIRTRQGHLHLPEEIAGSVVAVLGFDQRPAATTYHKATPATFCANNKASQSVAYTPRQVAQAYNFPTNTGKNQTIALIELGGGYTDTDLNTYWKSLGLNAVTTTAVSVDGAQNAPTGDANGPDGEVALDIEVAGGIAPAAKIAVYFAPNTDAGFLDAINAAIHDKMRKASVISISWGSPENAWTPQAMNAFNAAFHDAALLGITVCAAAGDNGSSDGSSDGGDHVDFPASSPWVLACGGTNLVAKGSQIVSETVWNGGADGGATGGGVSKHFSVPAYQAHLHVTSQTGTTQLSGRGVPDVAGVADPASGFIVMVDGQKGVIGGTSAVAPLWAGLVALLNEQVGRNVGWLHPQLYGTASKNNAFRDIVSGTNGDFKATAGWDACTGLGTPNGQAILSLLKK